MKIYRNRETGSNQETREQAAANRQAQVNATDQRIIVALEARQQQTQIQMGDIRRLSPPGLKEEMLDPAEDDQKNWKGIVIALLVISTICSFIMLSIVLLTPHMAELSSREQLKLEDFIVEGYEAQKYNGTWISNNEILHKEQNGSICIYNVENNHKEMLLDGALTRQYDAKGFSISSDHRYLLLMHDVKKTGHYSNLARYTIFDTKLHTFTPLLIKGDESDQHQYASWVPKHALIVIVHRNNIYLFTPLGDIQHILTQNGNEDLIFNGVPDMTYEEHIWNSNQGIWLHSYIGGWALCYATIDNSAIEQVPYILYSKNVNDTNSSNDAASILSSEDNVQDSGFRSSPSASSNAAYPKLFTYPYPKPGKPIPRIKLSVTKLNDQNDIVYKDQEVKPVSDINGEHILSTEPLWLSPYEFVATWTRRNQDIVIVSKCREQTTEWRCEKITEQKQVRPYGSLVLHSRPIMSASGQRMFLRLPVSDGAAGTFGHIAMITMDGKKQYLTHGQFVVSEIFAYREDTQTLYYAATSMEEPGLRHVYSLKHHNNSNERKIISCISCHVNESCLYNSARFSPDAVHFVLECKGPDFPMHYLIHTENETVLEVLDNSSSLRNWALRRTMPKIRHYSILTPQGYYIRLQLIIPLGVNELDDAKYPLVIETNRLPGKQSVNYLNKLDWARYLTSRREYITARIDTRGSAYQGDKHLYSIYKKVGEYELEDLKVALAYIKQLPYVDDSKIAVWGKEYGAYLAAGMLANEHSVACGVAVSPITSWKNYLAVFSERFMGKPEDNFLGYEQTELMKFSPLLKGRTLLIVHGTVDRRVNIQHTMQLMKSLTSNAIQYRTQLYPDSGSLETWDLLVRYHFYRTLEDFLAKCFQVEDEEDEDDILPITRVIKGGRIKQTQN